jgi:hypothetical protein
MSEYYINKLKEIAYRVSTGDLSYEAAIQEISIITN